MPLVPLVANGVVPIAIVCVVPIVPLVTVREIVPCNVPVGWLCVV